MECQKNYMKQQKTNRQTNKTTKLCDTNFLFQGIKGNSHRKA